MKYSGSINTINKSITKNVSFSVDENETLAIIGASGSGKTMTALSILGLLPIGVFFDGVMSLESKVLGRDIVYIPQNGHEFLNPRLKIKSQMKDTLAIHKIKDKNRMEEALKLAGFIEPKRILDSYPFELSGGMAQRVTLAFALLSKPKVLLCDEATNGLNYKESLEFIGFIQKHFKDSSRIVITHDLKVASLCDKILVLHNGNVITYGKANEVMNTPHPYILNLKNAMPEYGMQCDFIYKEDV